MSSSPVRMDDADDGVHAVAAAATGFDDAEVDEDAGAQLERSRELGLHLLQKVAELSNAKDGLEGELEEARGEKDALIVRLEAASSQIRRLRTTQDRVVEQLQFLETTRQELSLENSHMKAVLEAKALAEQRKLSPGACYDTALQSPRDIRLITPPVTPPSSQRPVRGRASPRPPTPPTSVTPRRPHTVLLQESHATLVQLPRVALDAALDDTTADVSPSTPTLSDEHGLLTNRSFGGGTDTSSHPGQPLSELLRVRGQVFGLPSDGLGSTRTSLGGATPRVPPPAGGASTPVQPLFVHREEKEREAAASHPSTPGGAAPGTGGGGGTLVTPRDKPCPPCSTLAALDIILSELRWREGGGGSGAGGRRGPAERGSGNASTSPWWLLSVLAGALGMSHALQYLGMPPRYALLCTLAAGGGVALQLHARNTSGDNAARSARRMRAAPAVDSKARRRVEAMLKAYGYTSPIAHVLIVTESPPALATLLSLFRWVHIAPHDVTVVDVSAVANGAKIRRELADITHQAHLPSVFVGGAHLGDSDDAVRHIYRCFERQR